MKNLQFATGGRPFANDDLLNLQTEVYDAIEATLQGAPAMVLSGCQVSRAAGAPTGDISAGYIWIAGAIQRYLGANGVPLPAEVVAGPADETDPRAYQTGGSQACMSELTLITQAAGTAAAGTELVQFVAAPVHRYFKWVESQLRQLGDLQDAVNLDPDWYDASGKGLADGPRAGWALANGNNGTKDLRGRFRVAYSDAAGDYDTVGKTGGKDRVTLSLDQIPAHTHSNGNYEYLVKLGQDSINASTDYSANEPTLTSAGKMQSAGGGQPFDARPPHYVTVVWQWIGLS